MALPPSDADGVNPSAASRIVLTGKRALVTGGHRGIGAAIVLGLAAAGAHVAVIDRGGNASRTSDVPSRVRGYGVEFFAAAADLGDPEQLMAAVSRVLSEFGNIDILVNNAYVAAWPAGCAPCFVVAGCCHPIGISSCGSRRLDQLHPTASCCLLH